jgi:hypothetical protein
MLASENDSASSHAGQLARNASHVIPDKSLVRTYAILDVMAKSNDVYRNLKHFLIQPNRTSECMLSQ